MNNFAKITELKSEKYESLSDLLDEVERRQPLNEHKYQLSTQDSDPKVRRWSGAASFKSAVKMAREGWPEGLAMIQKTEDVISSRLAGGEDISRLMDVAGDEVDVGLALEGDPECMVEYRLEPGRKPVVKLIVSTAFSASVSTDAITRRGAAICAAIDACEAAGVRVELHAEFTASRSMFGDATHAIQYSVQIKRAEDPLDMGKVAYVLMHPSMVRMILFRMMEGCPVANPSYIAGCYGYPRDMEEVPDDASYIGCLNGYDERWATVESTVKGTVSIIKQLTSKAR